MSLLRALVLEDNADACDAVAHLINREGFEIVTCGSLSEAKAQLESSSSFDFAIVDLELPDGDGMEIVRLLQNQGTEVLVITGHGSIDSAVEAMHHGVVDFLTKPLDNSRFEKSVRDVKRTIQLRQDVLKLKNQLLDKGHFVGMVGKSSAIRKVFLHIEKAAPTESTILVTGETGTGKELVANAIHRLSTRSSERLVSINCGALQPTLIESELFGHEQGSFTGASKKKKGVFEQADGGTLFLDELFEMPLDLQVKLLRVLETKEVTRIGAERPIPVDFRLIAATNIDLQQATKSGKVREDLLYRLMVFPIEVPPLRERVEDLPLLANHFLDLLVRLNGEHKTFAPEAMSVLQERTWPGNIRELRNVVERAYILSGSTIDGEHVTPAVPMMKPLSADKLEVQVGMTAAEGERALLEATLRSFGGDKKRSADTLGISLKTLYNRLKEYRAAESGAVD
jgi:DNA-binding NtrC family response regulator